MIFIDTFEPMDLETLIQQSVETIRDSFNSKGLPDYTWMAVDGHRIGVSRKQAGELLGGIDDAEEQLRRDMVSVDEMLLLVEGVFSSLEGLLPCCMVWTPSKDGKFLIRGHEYHVSYAGVQAWFSQLDKAGITVVQSFDWKHTAKTLVALHDNSQKKEHTTLQRYIKQKIVPKQFDPQVETLMGIKGARLGEKKAKALIERYGTVWYTLLQEPEELAQTEGIGMVIAKRLLNSIGRTV